MSDLATRLAEAVEKIGGMGYRFCGARPSDKATRPLADNLKALEDWLAGKGWGQNISRQDNLPLTYLVYWLKTGPYRDFGESAGADENETRAEAALKAFEAIKEAQNEVVGDG